MDRNLVCIFCFFLPRKNEKIFSHGFLWISDYVPFIFCPNETGRKLVFLGVSFLGSFFWFLLNGAIITFGAFSVYDFLFSRITKSNALKSAIWIAGVLVVFGWNLSVVITEVAWQNKLYDELNKRQKLLIFIGETIRGQDGKKMDLQGAIKKTKEKAKVIYGRSPHSEKIRHGYGGVINFDVQGYQIIVEYAGVPPGEPCHDFVIMNRVPYFKHVFVDGKVTTLSASGVERQRIKQELCVSDDQSVTIRFVAQAEDIVETNR